MIPDTRGPRKPPMKTEAVLSTVVAGFKLKYSVYDGKMLRPFDIDTSYPPVFGH
jgi:hypothetical protein